MWNIWKQFFRHLDIIRFCFCYNINNVNNEESLGMQILECKSKFKCQEHTAVYSRWVIIYHLTMATFGASNIKVRRFAHNPILGYLRHRYYGSPYK